MMKLGIGCISTLELIPFISITFTFSSFVATISWILNGLNLRKVFSFIKTFLLRTDIFEFSTALTQVCVSRKRNVTCSPVFVTARPNCVPAFPALTVLVNFLRERDFRPPSVTLISATFCTLECSFGIASNEFNRAGQAASLSLRRCPNQQMVPSKETDRQRGGGGTGGTRKEASTKKQLRFLRAI